MRKFERVIVVYCKRVDNLNKESFGDFVRYFIVISMKGNIVVRWRIIKIRFKILSYNVRNL